MIGKANFGQNYQFGAASAMKILQSTEQRRWFGSTLKDVRSFASPELQLPCPDFEQLPPAANQDEECLVINL